MSPSALDKLRIPSTNCRAFSAVALIWNSLPVRFHCYHAFILQAVRNGSLSPWSGS